MEHSKQRYPYVPFHDSASQIRLLHLLPGRSADEIRCWLENVDAYSNPGYEAISYAWGDPTITKPISLGCSPSSQVSEEPSSSDTLEATLSFQPFEATRNLEACLRHLRGENATRTLWVDAVCINQNDPEERQIQVSSMYRVYSNAQRVLVWLGPFDDPSDLELASDEYSRDMIVKALEFPLLYGTAGGDCDAMLEAQTMLRNYTFPYTLPLQRAFQFIHRIEISRDDTVRRNYILSAGLKESMPVNELEMLGMCILFCRPWFFRLWVLQELVSAKSASIICGNEEADLASFKQAIMCLYPWFKIHHISDFEQTLWFHYYVENWYTPNWLSKPIAQRVFQTLIETSGPYRSSDPRDRLYGILGIIGEDSQTLSALRPDYDKPLQDLYLDIAEYLVTASGTAAVVQYVDSTHRKSPTWVPTWNWSFSSFKDRDVLQSIREFIPVTVSSCKKLLRLKALPLGTVDWHMGFSEDTLVSLCSLQEALRKAEHAMRAHGEFMRTQGSSYEVRRQFCSMLHRYDFRGQTSDRTLEDYEEVMADTSSLDGQPKTFAPMTSIQAIHRVMANIVSLKDKIAVLSTGRIAVVRTANIDDSIYLVPGCRVPVVLRPRMDGFMVVGNGEVQDFKNMTEMEHVAALRDGPLDDITLI